MPVAWNERMLSEEEWDAMSWRARILFMMEKFGCKTYEDLSAKLFSGRPSGTTVKKWATTAKGKIPGKQVAEYMKKKCVYSKEFVEEPTDAACAEILLRTSVDAGKRVIQNALIRRDPLQLANVINCTAAKFAQCVTVAGISCGKTFVCRMESLYGRYPARTQLRITQPGKTGLAVTAIVSHAENGTEELTLELIMYLKGHIYGRVMTAANDYGLAYGAVRLSKYFNNFVN